MGNFNVKCLVINILLKEIIENCANGLLLNKLKINYLAKNDGYDLLNTQFFSCEFYKIYKNTYFEEYLRTAGCGNYYDDWKYQLWLTKYKL